MFKLINYRDKLTILEETNTQLTFRCPVCDGKLKLNINSGAYSCFTNYCKNNDIRNKLGYVKTLDNNYDLKTIVTKEVKFDGEFKPIKIDKEKYIPPTIRQLSDRTITKYHYNDNAVIERVDYLDENKKKECFPKYKQNGIWKYGNSDTFGLFNSKYLFSSLTQDSSLLIVEGEKCADIFTKNTNYLAVTFPSFGWNKNYILRQFIYFNSYIKNIIYIPDNDKIGWDKASLVELTSWQANLPCKIINLNDHFYSLGDGEDIADLIERESLYKILNIFEEL